MTVCHYKYKSGKICGKNNCKTNHKKTKKKRKIKKVKTTTKKPNYMAFIGKIDNGIPFYKKQEPVYIELLDTINEYGQIVPGIKIKQTCYAWHPDGYYYNKTKCINVV